MAERKLYLRGTHRIRSPEETWEWIAPLLPRVGITRVADVTALDVLGIPVFQAIRPAGWNLSVSQGKAVTAVAAKVSGVMESIELWHAERLEHLPQITATLGEMQRTNAIPTSALKLRSDAIAPDELPLTWVEARPVMVSAGEAPRAWLPRAMLELDFRVPPFLRPSPFHLTSNGLASGNSREEALLHGLCELIERHGLYRVHRQPELRTPVDAASVMVDWVRELMERIDAAGMKLAIYDLTFEVGIPVLLVDLVAADLPHVWRGSGCHPSPAVALSRALTEAAQARLTYISGARDDIHRFPRDLAPDSRFRAFMVPEGGRSFEELPDLASESVAADVERVVERLEATGHRAWYVDLSREEIGVPVITACVPGLREAPHV